MAGGDSDEEEEESLAGRRGFEPAGVEALDDTVLLREY